MLPHNAGRGVSNGCPKFSRAVGRPSFPVQSQTICPATGIRPTYPAQLLLTAPIQSAAAAESDFLESDELALVVEGGGLELPSFRA